MRSNVPLLFVLLAAAGVAVAQEEPVQKTTPQLRSADILGLEFAETSSKIRRAIIRTKTPYGFAVRAVTEGSLAAKAGIEKGTVVLEVNGQPLRELADLEAALQKAPSGAKLVLLCASRKPDARLGDRQPWVEREVEIELPKPQDQNQPPASPEPAVVMSPDLRQVVARLARAQTLDDAAIGIAGTKSDTYRAYERLRQLADGDQLRALLRHDKPVVRGYAALALAESKAAIDWKALLVAHLADTALLMTFEGCIQATQMYGDYLFDLVREHGLLRDDDWLDLGELLVQRRSPLDARPWALRTLRFRDGLLPDIRALAQAGDGPAAIALARYGEGQDVPILIAHLRQPDPFEDNCRFLAATISHDPRLLPVLTSLESAAAERLTRDNPLRLRFWLEAIAVHRNQEAADFLLRFLRRRLESEWKRKNLRDTYAEVLAPHAEIEVFAALRAELRR